jgi:hypothetical protein
LALALMVVLPAASEGLRRAAAHPQSPARPLMLGLVVAGLVAPGLCQLRRFRPIVQSAPTRGRARCPNVSGSDR